MDAGRPNITEVSALKVRIRFAKTGPLVYIGHLDVMRYFQKLFRRADIPVAYSEGFSPHQILSFSPPLPLGMESAGEYADVELTKGINSRDALSAMREQSVEEIKILSFKVLPERCENAMASVKAARYTVIFDDDFDADLKKAVSSFLAKDSVVVVKKTKKSESMIDLRPLVYELTADNSLKIIEMLISSGSTDNIKPGLVLNALFNAGEYDRASLDERLIIKRIDQYTEVDEKLVSLDDIGCETDE